MLVTPDGIPTDFGTNPGDHPCSHGGLFGEDGDPWGASGWYNGTYYPVLPNSTASDGTISVMIDNNLATNTIPWTTWTVEFFQGIHDTSYATLAATIPGPLIYSDPNVYQAGQYSDVLSGLNANYVFGFGIYYAVLTNNFGCQIQYKFYMTCDCDTWDGVNTTPTLYAGYCSEDNNNK